MAKRNSKTKQQSTTQDTTSALERQVLAFAEHLGYVAGSIESRAEGWMDREKLSRQMSGVRDGATQLLQKLASRVASRMRRTPAGKGKFARSRSGGAVDAPGKKHRKPAPQPIGRVRGRWSLVGGAEAPPYFFGFFRLPYTDAMNVSAEP